MREKDFFFDEEKFSVFVGPFDVILSATCSPAPHFSPSTSHSAKFYPRFTWSSLSTSFYPFTPLIFSSSPSFILLLLLSFPHLNSTSFILLLPLSFPHFILFIPFSHLGQLFPLFSYIYTRTFLKYKPINQTEHF